MLVRIPLGPSPWLHRLRGGSLRLVRQLRSYYGWVRLPAFVHHRLSVFPSRCGPEAGLPWPNAGSPKFRRDPFARDLLFDPGRWAWPRIAAMSMLRSTLCTVSAPATTHYGAQSHTPRTRCVRFVAGVAVGSRNTRFRAACWALPGVGIEVRRAQP